MSKNPMPTICFEGRFYSLWNRVVAVVDLASMDRIAALIWLNQNTTRRGYQKARPLIAASVGVAA